MPASESAGVTPGQGKKALSFDKRGWLTEAELEATGVHPVGECLHARREERGVGYLDTVGAAVEGLPAVVDAEPAISVLSKE